jgi:hypothetical protein
VIFFSAYHFAHVLAIQIAEKILKSHVLRKDRITIDILIFITINTIAISTELSSVGSCNTYFKGFINFQPKTGEKSMVTGLVSVKLRLPQSQAFSKSTQL